MNFDPKALEAAGLAAAQVVRDATAANRGWLMMDVIRAAIGAYVAPTRCREVDGNGCFEGCICTPLSEIKQDEQEHCRRVASELKQNEMMRVEPTGVAIIARERSSAHALGFLAGLEAHTQTADKYGTSDWDDLQTKYEELLGLAGALCRQCVDGQARLAFDAFLEKQRVAL